MSRTGACPCGAVRFRVDGPVRDVITCHCETCRAAAGLPWPASAAARADLVVERPDELEWVRAEVSAHGASRGFCRSCGAYVLWDAPERPTVSFAADLLDDRSDLRMVAHIWVAEQQRQELEASGVPVSGQGLAAGAEVCWHPEPGAARRSG